MTALLILALWVTVPLAVLVVGAWWIEHRDAEQGPPPTLRPQDAALLPFGLTDGSEDYAAAWERHVAEALRLAEPTPVYDALVCEEIERAEGWA